jgi:hypothetical protein
MEDMDKQRLLNPKTNCCDDWLLDKNYSPDVAERFRESARKKLYEAKGVKV